MSFRALNWTCFILVSPFHTCSSGPELKRCGKFVLSKNPVIHNDYVSVNIAAGRGMNPFQWTWSILSDLNWIYFSIRYDIPLCVSQYTVLPLGRRFKHWGCCP